MTSYEHLSLYLDKDGINGIYKKSPATSINCLNTKQFHYWIISSKKTSTTTTNLILPENHLFS